MAQIKNKIARLVLKGISILGIIFGLMYFFGAFFFVFSITRENLSDLFFLIFVSVAMLLVGVYLIRDSYLVLRRKAFNYIKSISAFFALIFHISVNSFLWKLDALFVGENRIMGDMIICAAVLCSLLLSVLVYFICNKLLKRLWETAYGTKDISETHNSTDKQ